MRATCITNWLRAGLPVAEVARRAGNSPEVIHRRYAGVIDDSEEENNKKIEKTMGWRLGHAWPRSCEAEANPGYAYAACYATSGLGT